MSAKTYKRFMDISTLVLVVGTASVLVGVAVRIIFS